jgi:MFS superfamily sulfate permease-like transporter
MRLTEFCIAPDGAIRERFPEDVRCSRLLIYGLEGEMFFGASEALENHLERIERRIDEHTRAVVLRLKRVSNPDAVGMTLLEAFADRVLARGVHVYLCGVRPEFADKLERNRLAGRAGYRIFREERVRLTSTILAIRHAYRLIDDPCADCPRRNLREGDPTLHYVI